MKDEHKTIQEAVNTLIDHGLSDLGISEAEKLLGGNTICRVVGGKDRKWERVYTKEWQFNKMCWAANQAGNKYCHIYVDDMCNKFIFSDNKKSVFKSFKPRIYDVSDKKMQIFAYRAINELENERQ